MADTGKEQVPTLLVGVGGLGSQVVERVFKRIPPDQRGRVVMHVLDTNALDLQDLDHLTGLEDRTQLGSAAPVAQYKLEIPETVAWFPYDPTLSRKSTLEGAGQVRAVARLTFAELLRRPGRLVGLETSVERLFRLADHGGLGKMPRVIVVNSWAGGTGAGAFLQLGLFLKSLMNELRSAPARYMTRGFFLMPDVLVGTHLLPSNQWELVRSNAMACLKEIEAIRLAYYRKGPPVRLEFRRGGRTETVPELPYDYLYLFDYQNLRGQVLDTLDDYLDQAARCLHLTLFSPLGTAMYSQEDNQIRDLIDNEGRTIYGGAATASLVYPREAVTDYLAHRLAAADLHEVWLRLDDAWAREWQAYEHDLAQGILRDPPDRADHYRRTFEELAREERHPFFTRLHPEAFETDERGRPVRPLADGWLDALESFVEDSLELDAPTRLELDPRELRRRDSVQSAVAHAERQIYDTWEEVRRVVPELAPGLAARVLTRDAEEPHLRRGELPFRLTFWAFREERHARHPLAVRHLLYDMVELLEARVEELAAHNRRTRQAIDAYERQYDLADTEDRVEDALDRIRLILSQPRYQQLLSGSLREFASLYEESGTSQYRRLQRYAAEHLKEEVFTRVLSGLRQFVEEWEAFFGGLRPLADGLERERNRQALEHAREGNPTVRYVLASRDAKEALWQRMIAVRAEGEAPALADLAYRALYERLVRGLRREPTPARHATSDFRDALLGHLKDVVGASAHLPRDLVEALAAEAELEGVDADEHASARLRGLPELAVPYFQVNLEDDRGAFAFYGLARSAERALPEPVRRALPAQARYDEAFHDSEAVFYTVRAGYAADELAKFTPAPPVEDVVTVDGVYYDAYRAQVAKVRERGIITPHLDRRWHDTLPDFWLAGADVDRVALLALAHGLLLENGGDWRFGRDVIATASRHDLGPLREALATRDDLIGLLRERAADQERDDIDSFGDAVHRHRFVRGVRKSVLGASNALDLVALQLRVDGNRPRRERERDTEALVALLASLIREYVARAIGDPAHADRRADEIVTGLTEASAFLSSTTKTDAGFREHLRRNVLGVGAIGDGA